MPLVLATNDAFASDYDWKDITGVQYHYPNGYRNLIATGVPFIYYRGVRRSDGSRGIAEYFGKGRVGSVWRDPTVTESEPKSRWNWYCAIDDFEAFSAAVPAKIDGAYFEEIKHENQWRNGVRSITEEVMANILRHSFATSSHASSLNRSALPPLDLITPHLAKTSLLKPRVSKSSDAGSSDTQDIRYNRSAKLVGDRAEQIVLRWLATALEGASEIRWVANEGKTPGWDIQFISSEGREILVEVKGTSETLFSSFELTSNELLAMKRHSDAYWLVLVADCIGTAPAIEVIANPAVKLEAAFAVEPVRWRCTAVEDAK